MVNVPEKESVAAYAIWDPAVRKTGIARLAVINTAIRNVTMDATTVDETVTMDLTPFIDSKRPSPKVKRMTAPGADSKDVDSVTWAGQAFTNGTASGHEVIEKLYHGKVIVKGSECVLVFF